jgi:hypothetical protein
LQVYVLMNSHVAKLPLRSSFEVWVGDGWWFYETCIFWGSDVSGVLAGSHLLL